MVPAPRRQHARELSKPLEPGPRSRWWIEALVIAWLCWIYDLLTDLAPLRNTAARHHAESILRLEKVLHVDPALAMNHWLAVHHALGLVAGDYYDIAHFVVTFGVVGWLWWRYPSSYRPLRNGLVITNLIGFAVFWRYPMAPPRMLPGYHYVDVVASSGAFGSSHSGTLATVSDQLAAMPSLHLAWAVWSAWAVFVVWRRGRPGGRRRAWLVWCYPAVTTLDVLSTGNHFVSDV